MNQQIMDEELNYVAVVFKPSVVSDVKTNDEDAVIYDELKTVEHTTCLLRQTDRHSSLISEKRKKAPVRTCLHLVAAGLGFVCIILISAIIILGVHSNIVMSEQQRKNQNLTEVNHQLWKDMSDLQIQAKQLSRERDNLNWTMGVIMEYDNFPVRDLCPRKVCTPCEDGWVHFQSNCYFFGGGWMGWTGSQNECRRGNANLVVIESQEEQEFITNHTAPLYYNKEYGFWIGMTEKMTEWLWFDGSHPTVQFWVTQQVGNKDLCVMILQIKDGANPLFNWKKANCDIGNRWICEKRALIKN